MKRSYSILVLILLLAGAPWGSGAREEAAPPTWEAWQDLVDDDLLREALAMTPALREQARQAGHTRAWTRALVSELQLNRSLGQVKACAQVLRSQPWPDDPRARLVLELFQAQALQQYLQADSYEIRQRGEQSDESREATPEDLESWSLNQFTRAVNEAYGRAWALRDQVDDGDLAPYLPYLFPNELPARVSGTVSDLVTYLWVKDQVNSRFWGPEDEARLPRLDYARLMDCTRRVKAHPLDSMHPLERVSLLLTALHQRHHAAGRREAAFHAQVELIVCLADAFPDQALAARQQLETVLADFDPSLPWWSYGQWRLARLARQEDLPDAEARAHLAAVRGARRHPDSLGGKLCARIMAEIEAPGLRLEAMGQDLPGRKTIMMAYTNVRRIHFRAWRYDWEGQSDPYRRLLNEPDRDEVLSWLRYGEPDLTWTEDLPAQDDYQEHQACTGLPPCPPGPYVVVASTEPDFREKENLLQSVRVMVGRLLVQAVEIEDHWELRTLDGDTGDPLPGVQLTLLKFQGKHRPSHRDDEKRDPTEDWLPVGELVSDGRGLARPQPGEDEYFAAVARRGEEISLVHRMRQSGPDIPRRDDDAFVYTDRAVYRPGQTVHWKAVCYGRPDDSEPYRPLVERKLWLVLEDSHGETIQRMSGHTNDFGSLSGSFTLPERAVLGRWTISTQLGGATGIQVEEFKRPTFEVHLDSLGSEPEFDKPLTLQGRAGYYFGLPVQAGTARWTVSQHTEFSHRRRIGFHRNINETVAEGEVPLKADGTFSFTFTPGQSPGAQDDDEVVYRYRVQVEVTSAGGETRHARRDFRLGRPAVQVGLPEGLALLSGHKEQEMPVWRRNQDNQPRPGPVSWRVQVLEQPEQTPLLRDYLPGRTHEKELADPDGPSWDMGREPPDAWDFLHGWAAGSQVAAGQVAVGPSGQEDLTLPALPAGCYRLTVETTDQRGLPARASRHLLVHRDGALPARLPSLLWPEQFRVPVGDTLRVAAMSGYAGQSLRLLMLRDGVVLKDLDWRQGRSAEILEIPITEDLRGGFTLWLRGARDFQQLDRNITVLVPWDNKDLNVELISFRDHLTPGNQETFQLRVTGPDSQAVAAGTVEIMATMYDRSLDLYRRYDMPHMGWLFRREESHLATRGELGAHGGQSMGRPPRLGRGVEYPAGDRLMWRVLRRPLKVGAQYIEGIPMLQAFDVEGAQYMVEVKSAMTGRSISSETFSQYAIDSVEDALSKQAGVVSRPGRLYVRGGRSADMAQPEGELRKDFAPTAFFLPHVQTDKQGAALIEFTVPDAVTDWQVWALALGRDLSHGRAGLTIPSRKDLMVRPYLPRFLREGDSAVLKVLVDNAADRDLDVRVDLALQDPDSDEDVAAAFGLDGQDALRRRITVPAHGSAELSYELAAPRRPGPVAVKVTAQGGGHRDGERHLLPVLPGRMHLMQSRFAALQDTARAVLDFPAMSGGDDPTLEQEKLVVTVDAQLFQGVLAALPYLVDYPYECAEQTLNRFLSAGMLSSVYARHPQVQEMARRQAGRTTSTRPWAADDPNRRLLLEETPWLAESGGQDGRGRDVINLLDPDNATQQTRASLDKLQKMQTSSGGFPWWGGGDPSVYMTLYVLQGLTRAAEFGLDIPEGMSRQAWRFLGKHYRREITQLMAGDTTALDGGGWRHITYLNYLLSAQPDQVLKATGFDEEARHAMLDHSYRHWTEHSRLQKAQLALTLSRAGRADDARRVMNAVMDRALTAPDLGTYWAPEDRSWLWFNDTVEAHAFVLRALTELNPDDPRRQGLVQWLFLNRHLGHWKSTRATAEVIYALVHHLEHEQSLGVAEDITVTVGRQRHQLHFAPDQYSGEDNHVVVPGAQIEPAAMHAVVVSKETPGLAFASATWHFSTERLPARGEGDMLQVERRFFRRDRQGQEYRLTPLAAGDYLVPGDQVEVELVITARQAMEYVHLRDPRAAGLEPEDLNSGHRWDGGLRFYQEVRDSGANFFFDRLPAGQYTLRHRLRADMSGTFKVAPAQLQSMYAPEFTAYSAGAQLRCAPRRD